ncbi:hypothetical protein NUM3379_33460 [Kineococcus sp. NUM-3379]
MTVDVVLPDLPAAPPAPGAAPGTVPEAAPEEAGAWALFELWLELEAGSGREPEHRYRGRPAPPGTPAGRRADPAAAGEARSGHAVPPRGGGRLAARAPGRDAWARERSPPGRTGETAGSRGAARHGSRTSGAGSRGSQVRRGIRRPPRPFPWVDPRPEGPGRTTWHRTRRTPAAPGACARRSWPRPWR